MTHLEPSQIIEFVRGSGDEPARAAIEEHIDDCEDCRERIAEAARHARGEVAPAASRDVDELTGTTLGRYRIGERLGAGGMGVVYVAEDIQLHRRVVIKLLRPELERAQNFERFRARLLREAQAMAQLSHPNVVQVYDLGAFDNSIYVAMEYLDGGDLRAWLAEKPRATSEILALFLQAAHGLAAAHEIGIVHRDFKPANVVVGANGRAKVADFGLARPLRGSHAEPADDSADDPMSDEAPARAVGPLLSAITQLGALVGTPAYMAPEQAANEQVDARADQYSFCLALYQAIERVKPSAIVDDSGAIRPPQLIPRHVWLAIRRGLSREPSDRFPSMVELVAALEPPSHFVRNGAIAVAIAMIAATSIWFFAHRTSSSCAVPELRKPSVYNDWLASYAGEWHRQYASTCKDPPELSKRRRTCLEWRAKTFEAIVDRAAGLSKSQVDVLAAHADSLRACWGSEYLPLDPIAPSPDLVAKITDARVRMARGEDVHAIAAAADAMGFAPLVAEVQLHLATTATGERAKIDAYTKSIRAALAGNAVELRGAALRELRKLAPEWTTHSQIVDGRLSAPKLASSECVAREPTERVYLPLDGNADDRRGHPTKILGEAANWVEGHKDRALDFDGFNDAIDVGSGPDLDNLREITECAWVRPRYMRVNYPAIIDKSLDNFVGGFNFYVQADGTAGLLTPYRDWALGGLVRLGEWHHVCGTWNGQRGVDNIAIYIDAIEVAHQDTGTNDPDEDTGNLDPNAPDNDAKNRLLVGRSNDGKYSFDGAIDEVRVWARAASWSEIMRLYDCSFLP